MTVQDIQTALGFLKSGMLRPGEDMEAAHEICQRHEGEAPFDWVHALVHRIEGDRHNADYWYRRAGQTRHPGTIEEEWEIVRKTLVGD